jgi:hypothetical protein
MATPGRLCHPRPSARTTRAVTARPAVRSSPGAANLKLLLLDMCDGWTYVMSCMHASNPDVASSLQSPYGDCESRQCLSSPQQLGRQVAVRHVLWGALLEILGRPLALGAPTRYKKASPRRLQERLPTATVMATRLPRTDASRGAQRYAFTIAPVLILSFLALRSCSQLFMHGTDTATTCVCQISPELSNASWASLTNQV